jgi:hypothetical protein
MHHADNEFLQEHSHWKHATRDSLMTGRSSSKPMCSNNLKPSMSASIGIVCQICLQIFRVEVHLRQVRVCCHDHRPTWHVDI